MSTLDARAQLAQEQAELVRALVRGGEPPAGFDEERVRLAARSLINKRQREVSRAWPALVECLGESFQARFAIFASRNPPPAQGGPVADGRAFVATLSFSELSDNARLELLGVELHSCWLGVRTRWLPQARQWVLGLRLPWLGVYVAKLWSRRGNDARRRI